MGSTALKYAWATDASPESLANSVDEDITKDIELESDYEKQVTESLQNDFEELDKILKSFKDKDIYRYVDTVSAVFFSVIDRNFKISRGRAETLAVKFTHLAMIVEGFELEPGEIGISSGTDRFISDGIFPKAKIKFKDRADKRQKPSEFVREHYQTYLEGNGLYQNILRRIDPSLMKGLDNEFKGRRSELAELIPTKQEEIQERLGIYPDELSPQQRKRALDKQRLSLR